jgi:hypothetical protein
MKSTVSTARSAITGRMATAVAGHADTFDGQEHRERLAGLARTNRPCAVLR